jgi:uncharacterized protein (TIGR02099 family)
VSAQSAIKFAAAVARWAVRIVLALLLLAALAWGVLHWAIVPRIDHFRPRLERLVTRWVGAPVTIGAISAQSNGLAPVIALTGVTVRDAQGRPGLTIGRARAAFSIASLLRGGVEQLLIEQPALDIRRTAQGRLLIGGLDISGDASGNTRAADWFFAQPEFAVQGGAVRWIDDTRPAAPPVTLSGLQLIIQNRHLHHRLRLDATPDSPWGEPFTIIGEFRQPILARHPGRWRNWDGQGYALLPRVDVSRLRQYVDLRADWGVDVTQGQGALRLWLDARHGAITGVTADLALGAVTATLGPGLQPLMLASLSGQVGWRRQDGRDEITTRNLHFADRDGLTWPGGNFQLSFQGSGSGAPESGALQADQLDLGVLVKIAGRLPLPSQVHRQLAQHPLAGRVETIQAHWSGALDAPRDWRVQARISGLSVGAQALPPHSDGSPAAGLPGIEGAQLAIQATPAGGQLDVAIKNGALTFPGVFEQPRIALQTLNARAQWTADPKTGQIAVDLQQAAFANADATGHLHANWHTDAGPGPARFPGVLDLEGVITRADGARVWRYLPLHIPQAARDYVRDAVQTGQARDVAVRVKGNLHDVPFDHNPQAGQFRFDAQVSGVTLAYVPRRLQLPGDAPPWPALQDLAGQLIFDRAAMQVQNAQAHAPAPNQDWQFSRINARMNDLTHPRVLVSANGRGPLASALAIVRGSPVASLLHGALDQAAATGSAALQLTLDLPVSQIKQASKVTGRVTLEGNNVHFVPAAPMVTDTRGVVTFDQAGFALQDLRGQALDGPVRIAGGGQPGAAGSAPTTLHITGTASSQGLRAMTDWGPVPALARRASGQAAYQAELSFHDQRPTLTVTSDLQGLAFDLPEPLTKPADARWPLRYEDQPQGATGDTWRIALADRLTARLERDGPAGAPPRGAYALGAAAAAPLQLPAAGIAAHIDAPRLDTQAWSAAVSDMLADAPNQGDASHAGTPPAPPASPASAPQAASATTSTQDFVPTIWHLRTDELAINGRSLHAVTVNGTRAGDLWHAAVQGRELDGQIQYRQAPGGQPGAVHARLSRLTIPASQIQAAKAGADDASAGAPPQHIPALDVVADDFEIAGKKLGKLTIEATNRTAEQRPDAADADPAAAPGANEWALDKLTLETPEATLAATGRWDSQRHAKTAATATRHTMLRFTLDVHDAGQLLTRLGMPGVIRHGAGQLAGDVAWRGAPYALDTPTLNGQLHLDMGKGQFLKADPGMAKLLGVLSLQALPRRLTLDFRDIFSAGFAFDRVRGDAQIADGVINSDNLQMKGAGAAIVMDGSASLTAETQDLHVLVVPHIDAGTAALAATAINPAIGIGAFVAQWLLQKPLSRAATREFRISGTWADPQVTALPHKAAAPASAADAAVPESGN